MSSNFVKSIGIIIVVTAGTPAVSSEFPVENQIVLLSVNGNDNLLSISQDYLGSGLTDANHLQLDVVGDRNGGARPWSSRLSASLGLEPGSLMQTGWGNSLMLRVDGNDNVFATSQHGHSNTINGTISGFGNEASVQQSGAANSVVFTQSGQRNTIVVSQSTH